MAGYTRVAHVGAGGSLGAVVLKELVDTGLDVTVLVRQGGCRRLRYNSESSLADALCGQEAVVSTMGSLAVGGQEKVIKAAISAGVKRFIPSDFGADLKQPSGQIEDLLEQEARKTDLSYTIVYNNLFLDWGLQAGFLAYLAGKKATLYAGGVFPVSMPRLSTVGNGVVGILKNPEQTKSRHMRIHDGRLSMKDLIEAVQEVTGAEGWTITEENPADAVAKPNKALSPGIFEDWVFLVSRARITTIVNSFTASVNATPYLASGNSLLPLRSAD
ncbi:uncharacterized protein NECHADRAFT_89339 [Fusarium vanettenii 77-13-4]|uniref:NmrA-like domain-containing protein n=1 Tax=Fusarium vanettenii (strain ATCC MYA-4622 / CBS 123669 / FGSC 9596 / NRRL 45880 / 77-13-4) TaxID=660122 RepID=C7ZQW5_FUSV7|nr:uncharacterized protein NECHADRAFT_89339 [Fusarium vanettenii 77-13-4]EEU33595.1 hypothetical protein NECHADRAFT_89339 [Fusarium vanettenii 77-13-4]